MRSPSPRPLVESGLVPSIADAQARSPVVARVDGRVLTGVLIWWPSIDHTRKAKVRLPSGAHVSVVAADVRLLSVDAALALPLAHPIVGV